MVLTKAIDVGLRVAQLAYKYGKGASKFTSGETSFITRFPPRYRSDVRTILKGAQTVSYGGLIAETLMSQDGTDSGEYAVPKNGRSKTGKQYQTRSRYRGRTGGRYRQYKHFCKCRKYPKRSF